MKKAIKYIIAGVQLAITVTVTVVMAQDKSFSAWMIVLSNIMALFGILMSLFGVQFAKMNNIWHSMFYRKKSSDENDEPSTYAIVMTTVSGYLLFCMQFIFLFLYR